MKPDDDAFAARLRGFGSSGLLAILVVLAGSMIAPLVGAILVLAWARRSRTPWREIGFVPPRSWIGTVILAALLGGVFKLAMKSIVMPLLGAPPVNAAFHHLAGNTAALPGMILAVTVGAGFGEETVYRGYLFERLRALLGTGVPARMAIVLFTSVVFGLIHYSGQGLAGAQQATIVGLVLGSVYAFSGRLFPLMCAHAAFDLVALALIYWDVESAVAQLFFR